MEEETKVEEQLEEVAAAEEAVVAEPVSDAPILEDGIVGE